MESIAKLALKAGDRLDTHTGSITCVLTILWREWNLIKSGKANSAAYSALGEAVRSSWWLLFCSPLHGLDGLDVSIQAIQTWPINTSRKWYHVVFSFKSQKKNWSNKWESTRVSFFGMCVCVQKPEIAIAIVTVIGLTLATKYFACSHLQPLDSKAIGLQTMQEKTATRNQNRFSFRSNRSRVAFVLDALFNKCNSH